MLPLGVTMLPAVSQLPPASRSLPNPAVRDEGMRGTLLPRVSTSLDMDAMRLEGHYAATRDAVINTTHMIAINPMSMYWEVTEEGKVYVALSISCAPGSAVLPVVTPHVTLVYEGVGKVGVDAATIHRALMHIKHEMPTCVLPTRLERYGRGSHFRLEKTSVLYHVCRSLRSQALAIIDDPFEREFHITWNNF